MPNIKSAKKRVKVISAKTLQNQIFKSQLKTAIKKFVKATEDGDKAAAEVAYTAAVKMIDKAVCRNIIHKNCAARKKSRLARKVNALAK